MSRALTSRQAELAGKLALRAVPLVTLVTYSDLYAGTVSETFRWSDRALTYASAEYLPYLVTVGELREEMNHIPSPTDALSGAWNRDVTITLRNALADSGEYLSEVLRGENLERARVTISQLLLYPSELSDYMAVKALAGTEHVVLYRGEVLEVARVDEAEIELRLGSTLPDIPWVTIPDDGSADPRDTGKRLHLVYGTPKLVPLHNLSVGAISTTVTPIGTTEDAIQVADASRFGTTGNGKILYESISWTGKYGTTHLTGVTRGASGTTAAQHLAGSTLVEIPASITLALGQGVTECDDLYVRNLLNDQIVKTNALTTVDTEDTASISGATISTLSMTSEALEGVIESLVSQARVTVQPSYADSAPSSGTAIKTGPTDSTFTSTGVSYCTWSSTASTTPYAVCTVSGTRYVLRRTFTTSGLSASDIVTRWRLKLRVLTGSDAINRGVSMVMRANGVPGIPDGTSIGIATSTYSQEFEATSDWVSPPEGTVMTDLDTAWLDFEAHWNVSSVPSQTATMQLVNGAWGVEAEYTTTTLKYRAQDAEISAAAGGVGLEFYGDLRGQNASAYSVGSTTQLSTCESTTGWAAYNSTLSLTSTTPYQGTYAVRSAPTGAATSSGAAFTITSTDCRRKAIQVAVRFDSALLALLDHANGLAVELALQDSAANVTWWSVDYYPTADTWGVLTWWTNNHDEADLGANAADLSDVVLVYVLCNHTATGTTTTHHMDIDDLKITSSPVVWDAAPSTPIRTAPDIVRHLHTTICGESTGTVDDDSKQDASEALGEYVELHTCLDYWGSTYAEVLARIGYESRMQVMLRENTSATQIYFSAATMGTAGYSWPAATETITQWVRIRERGRAVDSGLATRFTVLADRDWSQESSLDAYRLALQADAGASDFTHAPTTAIDRAALDSVTHTGLVFDSLRDADSLDYVAGYYIRESAKTARLLEVEGVPWVEAFALERGDIVSITPPWRSAAVTGRVIVTAKSWDSQLIDLVIVEV